MPKKFYKGLIIGLFLVLPFCLWVFGAFGATYYMRSDGTAANKAAATGPGSTQANCMSIATHDGETFAADDVIVLCDDGGIFRDQMDLPSSGTSGHPIIYQVETGDTPIISGYDVKSSWTSEGVTGNAQLVGNPNAFGSWTATQMTVNDNVATVHTPYNDTTAETLQPTGSNQTCDIYGVVGVTGSTQYNFSVYVAAINSDFVELQLFFLDDGYGGLNNAAAYFNITNDWSTAAVGTHGNDDATSITRAGPSSDGLYYWYRISITDTSHADAAYVVARIYAAEADNDNAVTGDGTAWTAVTRAKVEAAVAPSAYENFTSYFAACTNEPLHAIDDGTRISKYGEKDMFANGFWFDVGNNRIYVRLTGDANPSGSVIEAANRQYGILINGKSWITVDGIEFNGTQSQGAVTDEADYGAGICIQVPDDNGTHEGYIFQNNAFDDNGTAAILAFCDTDASPGGRTLDNVTISGNTFDDGNYELENEGALAHISFNSNAGDTFWTNITVEENSLDQDDTINPTDNHWHALNGIWLLLEEPGATIQDNEITNVSHGIILEGKANTEDIGSISYNYIHDTNDDCIWIYNDFDDLVISYNILVDSLDNCIDVWHSGAASGDHDNLYIYNNVCESSGNSGIYLTHVTHPYIYNNIFYDTGTTGAVNGRCSACGATTDVVIYIDDTPTAASSETSDNIDSDNNDFYNPTANKFIRAGNFAPVNETLAQWKTSLSEDANSINSDPLFTDAANDDFTLTAQSPCIDAGANVGATYDDALKPGSTWPDNVETVDQDLYGAGWDIGAFAYTGHLRPLSMHSKPMIFIEEVVE